LRIISGKYKGKIIIPPKNFRARPTTDFAKEALFNILNNKIDFTEIKVLDLFAGTGSIGFEFASRDALFVDMIEKSPVHHEFIKKNILNMKMQNARAIKTDVFVFIDHMHQSYDLIFADPPYDMEGIETIPDKILASEILKPDGCFIFEHSKKLNYTDHQNCFDQRVYGNVHFSFFRKNF
jgi:16S rRNA (guanine966-N2)-methyltransferase